MMGRRPVLAAGLALGASVLSGCGLRGRTLDEALNEAAGNVDGVTSSALETVTGAEFQRAIRGRVEISAARREQVLEIFGEVMTALVDAAYAQADADSEGSRVVGAITALSSDGEEYGIWDLRPDLEQSAGRLDAVLLSDFAE
ncbi:hypothetical protein [Brachybacterium sacelli]|uniref:Uncharacterized protein n=2 Tax=Brachybacterium sacelli TaxID=173364 RepID=A0ABS4X130_9MICO|nr:hypothetical protein [Brachybacterium sacelli]MBP2382098.1 hypothetical protein [Brachybacterium sacelli]